MHACRKVSTTYLPGALVHMWGNTQEARELRAHPDFPDFARELGMPQVWDKFGWPDVVNPHLFEPVN